MKKITLFAVVAIAALSMSSCRKDHTCTCTESGSGYTFNEAITAKTSKKDAKAWCDATQTEMNAQGSAVTCTTN